MINRVQYIYRLAAVSVFCLGFVSISQAQLVDIFSEDDHRTFYGGLTAGGNFSTVDGDSYSGYKKAGWVIGGTVYAHLFSGFFANVELLYTQKGSRGVVPKTSVYAGDFFERFWLDLNYVEIPLIIHCKVPYKWNMHLGVGGSYARLLKSNEEIYSDQPIVINWGLQIANRWFLNARYQRSVRTIRDPKKVPIWQGFNNQYNDLFSLRLLYLIGN